MQGVSVRNVMSWGRKLLLSFLAVALLVVNLRLYSPASSPANHDQLSSHLRYLNGSIDQGLAGQMQGYFPEGFFFTHVLYGLTWVELGLHADSSADVRSEALTEARTALMAIDSAEGRAPFSASLDPAYGGFYVGWSNYLRAGIVALQVDALGDVADPVELQALRHDCDAIVEALGRSDSPFLASYVGEVWPVDTYPAMVSVKGCAEYVDDEYQLAVDEWLEATDDERDATHELVGHRHEPFREHPRATSQTLILRFLAELDPERSAEAYERFRSDFVVSRLGLPAVREHPHGVNAGGDVDSGPLITGVSLSASVVAISTARVNGDHALATALRQQGQAFGFPLPLPGGRRYLGGVLPIGDLFVVWSSSAQLWFQPEVEPLELGPGWAWRLPTHIASVFVGLSSWFLIWPGTQQRLRRVRDGFGVWSVRLR